MSINMAESKAKKFTARSVLEVYKAYRKGEFSPSEAVEMAKKASQRGDFELLRELSYFIYSKADEEEAYEFSKFLYKHGHEDLIPLNHLLKIRRELSEHKP